VASSDVVRTTEDSARTGHLEGEWAAYLLLAPLVLCLAGVGLLPGYGAQELAQRSAIAWGAVLLAAGGAVHWGLAALADGVVDEPNARTRFVLVGPPGPPPARTGADRTSVVFRIDNVPGALLTALAEFGIRGIDLTRIESRPTRTELGTYLFFADCVGHIDDGAVAEALKALHRRCADVRYLGSWPTGSVSGVLPPPAEGPSRWLEGLREGKPERSFGAEVVGP